MNLVECIISLLAGSAVFIAGMKFMSDGLEKISGPSMKKMLKKISDNKIVGVSIGAAVTALIQSSAATTVMVIGFVNAGAMTLIQGAPIIMGANIGTTVTGLLVSLSSLDFIDVNLWMSFFAFIGIVLMFFKKDKIKYIGSILTGLGMIFIGLDLMSGAFNGTDNSLKLSMVDLFNYISFPLLLIILGIIFTAILQSSSAMTGLVIVMVSQGAISVGSALFIIIGTNVGTCFTSLLATIGSNTNAKRTGILHLTIKSIGAIIFTILVWILKGQFVDILNSITKITALQVALFHLFFNVVTTILLLPFTKAIVNLVIKMVPEKENKNVKNSIKHIDERLLRTPEIAVLQVKKEIENMAELAKLNLALSIDELLSQSGVYSKEISEREEEIDYINAVITKFLIKLSPLASNESERVIGSYFHVVNDIERIGDHAQNFLDVSLEMKNKDIHFSKQGQNELETMYKEISNMYDIAINTFDDNLVHELKLLDEIEETTDEMKDKFTASHYERLSKSECTIELGSYYTSVIAGLERVADHLVNIGYSINNPTGDQETK